MVTGVETPSGGAIIVAEECLLSYSLESSHSRRSARSSSIVSCKWARVEESNTEVARMSSQQKDLNLEETRRDFRDAYQERCHVLPRLRHRAGVADSECRRLQGK